MCSCPKSAFRASQACLDLFDILIAPHDVAGQRKQAKLARKAKAKGPPPARTARLNLTTAATVGPVLTDMYVAARGPMGDG